MPINHHTGQISTRKRFQVNPIGNEEMSGQPQHLVDDSIDIGRAEGRFMLL